MSFYGSEKETSFQEKIRKYHQKKEELTKLLEREPIIEEMAIELNESKKECEIMSNLKIEKECSESFVEPSVRVQVIARNYLLEKIRLEKGLTQDELSKKSKISSSVYSAIERCKAHLPCAQEKIAEVLEQPYSLLFPESIEKFTRFWREKDTNSTIVPIHRVSLNSPEVLALTDGSYEQMLDRSEAPIMINKILSLLNEKERKILDMRFGLTDGVCRTLEEVGDVFGVTRERIRQLEHQVHDKIHQKYPSIDSLD